MFASFPLSLSSTEVVTHPAPPLHIHVPHVEQPLSLDPASLEMEKDLKDTRWTLPMHTKIISDAKSGDLRAVNCVAGFYLDGSVLNKDEEKGIRLFLWSAEHKDANAMYELGTYYAKIDPLKSRMWKERAAKNGHFEAADELYGSDE